MLFPLKDENPTYSFPIVTIFIIAVNILIYIYQESLGYGYAGEKFIYQLGAIPYEITHFHDIKIPNLVPPPFTLITAMFLHGSWAHLIGNIWYLWIFGNNIEDIMGKWRFIIFYLLCGVIAGLAHVISVPDSSVPMIGASGAISGVLGAYFIIYPRARVLILIFLFIFIRFLYVPAVLVLGFWFVIQILSASSYGEGVAWFAHIGGFIAGAVLVRLLIRRRSQWS